MLKTKKEKIAYSMGKRQAYKECSRPNAKSIRRMNMKNRRQD